MGKRSKQKRELKEEMERLRVAVAENRKASAALVVVLRKTWGILPVKAPRPA